MLEAAGFTLEVDRVRLDWSASSRPTPRRLTVRLATTFPEGDLVEVFAAVSDGSVDHGMITGRAEHGRREEAAIRLGQARRRKHEDDWFVIGVDGAGVPVGYVQSALDVDDMASWPRSVSSSHNAATGMSTSFSRMAPVCWPTAVRPRSGRTRTRRTARCGPRSRAAATRRPVPVATSAAWAPR